MCIELFVQGDWLLKDGDDDSQTADRTVKSDYNLQVGSTKHEDGAA